MHRCASAKRIRTGGTEAGTEIYHYGVGSDSPAWTEEVGDVGAPAHFRPPRSDLVCCFFVLFFFLFLFCFCWCWMKEFEMIGR